MAKYSRWILGIIGILGVFSFFMLISSTTPVANSGVVNNITGNISGVAFPEKLSFSDEIVPLDKFDIRESLDKELLVNTYWHSQTLLMIKRANRFFPVIEPILKKNGIPDDFKYLALAESGFTNISSPVGASGFWQFMKETAKEYDLEVNDEIDERYNLEKVTEAACKYFQSSYNVYKNWTMAAASYNLGRKGLNRQISRQYTNNYYDIILNDETARYVFRILALKAIISEPARYGFAVSKEDLYPPFEADEISINYPIKDLAQFAFQHGTNYKMIKIMNPWIRDNFITNASHKTYKIKIPKKGVREFTPPLEQSDIDSILARSSRLTVQ